MSEPVLIIIGAAALAGVVWIVSRILRSRTDAGGDGGGIVHDGTSSSSSGSNCAGLDGDGGGGGGD